MIGMRRPLRRFHAFWQHGVFDFDHAVERCVATPECSFFALSTSTWLLSSCIVCVAWYAVPIACAVAGLEETHRI